MDDLLQEFIAETRETLEALSGEIVAWEAHPADRARLDAIFRFVHTVKGSCGFLDLPRLGRLSHAAEDVLAQVRDGKRAPDRALVNAVLAVVDRIGELVEAIESGTGLDDSGDELLVAALAEGAEEIAHAGPIVSRAPARSVRLNVDLLDRMMSGMSDMVLARNELARRLRQGEVDPAIEAALERLSLTVGEMRDTVTRTRMQKIDALFSALPRMVRDTAAGLGKSVMLQVEGSDVELDREMIEVMRDPLVHIIRNSIDHGIEAPAERRAGGKRENGRLSVSARQSGNQIIIEIADDGRGIDTERLIQKLVAQGRDEAKLRSLSNRAKLDLVFEPGLSSKDVVSEVSGRGVGMDVVRAAIEQIGGRVELDSNPGKGLRLAIHVPLTLSIISTIVVGVDGQRFAIPRQSIEEIVTERGDAIRVDTIGGSPVATVRERRMPLIHLADMLGLPATTARDEGGQMLAIVSVSEGSYALAVDTVLDNEELVIKPASPAVMSTGLYAGQTLPDSGLPMLLLDCAGMAKAASLDFSRDSQQLFEEEEEVEAAQGLPALLFRDLDGVRRAVPLAAVDRVEQVDAANVRFAAGRFRVTIDERILPLAAHGDLDGLERINVLRLKDGTNEVSYAIDEAADIVLLPEEIAPAREPGPIAGVVLVEGEQIELVDMLWIFDEHAEREVEDAPPLCLISGDNDGWMASFVKPLLEASGYRVALRLAPGETPAVVLSTEENQGAMGSPAPVVRLRKKRASGGSGDDSVYRYDRAGLLSALEARVSGKAGR
ncbi:two-component system chemotaxis sensor kinase CheA [Sphingomonas kyeonggiensis]|uniref:Chemotaxis protein CheA n=2 Tax=Pseudomonadota TaxID=1224 RepID=A0A7W7NRN2_9SPHN|nr:chemotaxis protein CheW [Sphingomonas kyeonggiensis]MBB4839420.1 two-component system chemotaxis sensor kinase CheA [Sphingomonas kyeonggiensis]